MIQKISLAIASGLLKPVNVENRKRIEQHSTISKSEKNVEISVKNVEIRVYKNFKPR